MRIGRWSIHHPRLALTAWIAFVVAAIALGAITGTKTLDNGAVGESARGYAVMDRYDLWGPGRELAYLHSERTVPERAIRDVERRLAALGVKVDHARSHDGRAAVVSAEVDSSAAVDGVRRAVAAAARAHPQIAIQETGDVSADEARNRVV